MPDEIAASKSVPGNRPGRRADGTMLPGHSSNPSGRPAGARIVAELAGQHHEAAIKALVAALDDPKQSVAAARELLDRYCGKAPQAVTGPDGGPIEMLAVMPDEELQARARAILARIDAAKVLP